MVEQNQIDLEKLKILDNRDYTREHIKDKKNAYLAIISLIFIVILTIFAFSNFWTDLIVSNNILLIIFGFFMLLLIYGFVGILPMIFIKNNLNWLFILVICFDYLISAYWWILPYNEKGEWLFCNLKLNVFVWGLSILAILLHTITYFRLTLPYMNRSISQTLQLTITYISIPTMIYGADIFEPKNIVELALGSFVMILTVSLTFISLYMDNRISKNEKKANKIFQEQLMLSSSQINYDRLKLCYYYGGETYKDKMLSNEKMLRKIMSRENRCS